MKKRYQGFSLIEMLIVLSIFAILVIVITQTLSSSLKGAKKSESVGLARENVEQVLNVIERRLRGASSIDCVNSRDDFLQFYLADDNTPYNFTCNNVTGIVYFGSQQLSSSSVRTTCSFYRNCLRFPHLVTVEIKAESLVAGSESSSYESSVLLSLRNYQ